MTMAAKVMTVLVEMMTKIAMTVDDGERHHDNHGDFDYYDDSDAARQRLPCGIVSLCQIIPYI